MNQSSQHRNTMNKEQEDALIEKAVQGDQAAASTLYQLYRGLLLHEAHARYLQSPLLQDEAEGLSHLTFVEALHTYDSSRGIHFAGYLQSKVQKALYDHFRRTHRELDRTSHVDEQEDFWGTHPSIATASHEDRFALKDLLQRAIALLTPAEKSLLQLIYLQEAPLKTIAALLKITPQAVSKKKKALLAQLRTNMTFLNPCNVT